MSRWVSATEARAHFGELIARVVDGHETVIVERGGKPEVVMLSVGEYNRLTGSQERPENWLALVDEARRQIREELGDQQLPPAEDLVRQMREERDEQLLIAIARP